MSGSGGGCFCKQSCVAPARRTARCDSSCHLPCSVVQWRENGLGTSRGRRTVMTHALRYEPQGQRQHFEPREQDRHLHLHFHLHLKFRAREWRFSPLSAIRLTRIFAALVGATYLALFLNFAGMDSPNPGTWALYSIAGQIIYAVLVLTWGAAALGGLPLLVSAWLRTPRLRFLLVFAFLLLLLIPLGPHFPFPPQLRPIVWFFFAFILAPLISTSLLVRALRQAAIADRWLRFASRFSFIVVGTIVLLLLAGFLLCLAVLQGAPMTLTSPWLLPSLLGMCIAVLVAVSALLGRPRSRESTQARPKDASPSDVDSSGEP